MTTTPRERTVLANGLAHHVVEWGPPVEAGRPTVLALHGFLDLAWGWRLVAERLAAAGMTVLAPDLRGHGETQRIGAGGAYHFVDYLFDVADLVDALVPGPLHLIGHSMGGALASYFTGTYPARVDKLVVMEGIGLPEEPVTAFPLRTEEWITTTRRARARRPRVHADLDAATARMLEQDGKCPPDFARFLAERGTVPAPDGRGLVFRHDPLHLSRGPTPFRLDMAESYWRRIACPVLFVDGSESPFAHLPDLERRYASFGDGTRAHRRLTLEGAGHMMIRHRPEELARGLVEFLSEK